ncbi:hypothetical protein DAPPUDRAFT_261439 [Daphnia pulex]|uniref:Uncharacterized protein n=1 Tax=Daphnia pulex TaxID=6669 RepID=E9HL11_DAPPU|nr:hypothetical protein DAPPUDRAFT_261439 [Daphnia pulex]|eukprot:EFX67566.1 hypothetical protein DAPPUDRAFT_261439 [Daphnia pulex]
MSTAQLPVITEESASVAEQEQSTVVDPKTMDRSQLVRQRGNVKSRHTRLLTTLHSGMTFNIARQFKDEARKHRSTLVQEYENVDLCHNLVLAACATEEDFNKEFCWFETFTETHRKMLADIDAYLCEGLAASLKPAASIRSRSSRASSRNSAQSKEDKIQEKARKVAETELRLKQAQEGARLREIEKEKIRRLEEDKRKEELKVEAELTQRQLRNELEGHHLESQILIQQLEVKREGSRPVTPIEAQENFSHPGFLGSTTAREFSSRQGCAGKNQGFFSALTPARMPSSHGPAEEDRPPRKPRRSLDATWIQAPPGWNGSSASLAAPIASSEKKKTSWPQPSTPEIITVPPGPTAPAPPPPRCEASVQNQFLRPPISASNEYWERAIEQDDGRYAEQLCNKVVSQSVSATFLNPLAGAFEPRAGLFSLSGSSMSVVQPRSFGGQEEGSRPHKPVRPALDHQLRV